MRLRRFPIHPAAVLGAAREVRAAGQDFRPIVVAGDAESSAEVARGLAEGGDADAVRDLAGRPPLAYDLDGAGLLVYAVRGAPEGADLEAFRLADRKDVQTVLVVRDPSGPEPAEVPYVLATNVVRVRNGPLPLDELRRRVADSLDEDTAYAYASRLPALRRLVAERIVERFSRQNGVIGVAVFVPGADLPVLTLNQIRMVLRLAAAYGEEIDRDRAVELAGVIGAGLGLRTLAREALGFVPGPGWAIKGGIAYAGTKALGEAAIRYFKAGGQGRIRHAAGSVRSRS
jgi:uncharacterized protein (DUF697 family)